MAETAVTVVGGGAIGGITAAYLARRGLDVLVVDPWQEHVQAMRGGLKVEGCRGSFIAPIKAITPEELAGPLDLVLLAVKSMHTEPVLRQLLPLLQVNSTIVSLQNSINEDLIAGIIGVERTVGCVVGWGAITAGPGRLIQVSPGEFVVGKLTGFSDRRLEMVRELLIEVADCIVTGNIYGFLWAKLLANCAISVGALQGKIVAEMVDLPEAREVVTAVVGEVLAVAGKMNIVLETVNLKFEPEQYRNQADLIAGTLLNILKNSHGDIMPTAYQDLIQGKPLETEYINGYIANRGKELGIPTPTNRALVAMVHEIEQGKRRVGVENICELKKRL